MITPVEYEKLYKNLKVEFADSSIPPQTVSIHKYWLSPVQPAGQKLIESAEALLAKGDLDVKINGSVIKLSKSDHDLHRRLRYALAGKGSPEDYQMVLQLAVLTKQKAAADLQSFCDDNLGIDCNGFVGNYLWHLKNPWPALFPPDKFIKRGDPPNPDMTVDGFFDRGRAVRGLGQIQPSELNVFGWVDPNTFFLVPRVVQKAGKVTEDAHVVISEPGKFSKVPGGIELLGVESTGINPKTGVSPGLTDGSCKITEYFAKGKPVFAKNYPAFRVFNVFRDSKKQDDLFVICSFSTS